MANPPVSLPLTSKLILSKRGRKTTRRYVLTENRVCTQDFKNQWADHVGCEHSVKPCPIRNHDSHPTKLGENKTVWDHVGFSVE